MLLPPERLSALFSSRYYQDHMPTPTWRCLHSLLGLLRYLRILLAAVCVPAHLLGHALFLITSLNGLWAEKPDNQDYYNLKINNKLKV